MVFKQDVLKHHKFHEFWNKIIPNQRFILNHKSAFKITQINSFMMDDINTEEVPLLELFIEWTSILPSDDLENNLADINYGEYKISFDIDDITAPNGYKGVINTTVTRQDEICRKERTHEKIYSNYVGYCDGFDNGG